MRLPTRHRATGPATVLALVTSTALLAGCGTAGPADRPAASGVAVPASPGPTSAAAQTFAAAPAAPAAPAASAASGSGSGVPSEASAPAVAIDGGLPAGDPPRTAYEVDATLVLGDGSTRSLPRHYDTLALTEGLLVGAWSDGAGRRRVDVVRDDDVSRRPGGTGLAISPSGRTLVWDEPDTLVTGWDAGEVGLGTGFGAVVPTAVLGDGDCHEQADDTGGCTVFFTDGDRARFTSSHGIRDQAGDGTLTISDVDAGGRVATMTSRTDDGSCWAVQRPASYRYVWTTCDHSLLAFSPDDAHLLATTPYVDGLGLSSLSLLDASDGSTVVSFRAEQGHIAEAVWEGPTTVLATTYGPRGWRILRLALDGSAHVLARDPGDHDELDAPWTLALT